MATIAGQVDGIDLDIMLGIQHPVESCHWFSSCEDRVSPRPDIAEKIDRAIEFGATVVLG